MYGFEKKNTNQTPPFNVPIQWKNMLRNMLHLYFDCHHGKIGNYFYSMKNEHISLIFSTLFRLMFSLCFKSFFHQMPSQTNNLQSFHYIYSPCLLFLLWISRSNSFVLASFSVCCCFFLFSAIFAFYLFICCAVSSSWKEERKWI